MKTKLTSKIRFNTYLLAVVWLTILLFGIIKLLNYASRPGQSANASINWPKQSHLKHNSKRWTLVIFMHPMCSCSYATLEELDKIMNKTHGKLDAFVVFYRPGKFPAEWEKSKLMTMARAIPGVTTINDEDGKEAKIFGSLTSGESFLYNPTDQLAFNGGITKGRAHQGDNAGEDSIIDWVNNNNGDTSHTFVFGCDLFKKTSELVPYNGGNIL